MDTITKERFTIDLDDFSYDEDVMGYFDGSERFPSLKIASFSDGVFLTLAESEQPKVVFVNLFRG